MTVLKPVMDSNSGFIKEPAGTHTSRTLMLSELRRLLGSVGSTADYVDYEHAAVELNAVHKATLSTRRKTLRHLRELYALSRSVILFRALQDLWAQEIDAQPLIACLCAAARDPLLCVSSKRILDGQDGDLITPDELADEVEHGFPGRFRADTLARTGRNLASSWTQSGHLEGRSLKRRRAACCTPAVATYSLLLGYLCGSRGEALFKTSWARITDAPEHILRAQAAEAARLGFLDYRHAGGVTEVTFPYLLRGSEALAR